MYPTKKEMKEKFDFHKYGRGRRGEYVIYAKLQKGVANLDFACRTGEKTKKEAFEYAYQAVCDLQDMDPMDWAKKYMLRSNWVLDGDYYVFKTKGAAYRFGGGMKIPFQLSGVDVLIINNNPCRP